MSYRDWTIHDTLQKIVDRDIYLPAIQRNFIWKPEQIISLFDSIMRGYPIGTFLFWFVKGDKKNEYTFYQFLNEYHPLKSKNLRAPNPISKDEIIGVLDGQQRLSSLYLTLQGYYAYKKPYVRRTNKNAYPKRHFYLNLLKDAQEDESGLLYEFKFLTLKESKEINQEKLWFLVRDVIKWGEDPDIDHYFDSLLNSIDVTIKMKKILEENKREIKHKLRILHKRIMSDKVINYFEIGEQDLDKILDIFVRVNSGGTVLSKTDLLFSTIVANWEEGRDEIQTFLQNINERGNGYQFDTDFIMRACLVLTDCPILFKVNNFRKENIEKIRHQWNNIKESIEKMIGVIIRFGFTDENLTSYNALIPICYHIMKGGNISKNSMNNMRKYLIHAQIKQIYGGQGDTVLSRFRDQLRIEVKPKSYALKLKNFSFNEISKTKFPGDRTLIIDEKVIHEIFDRRKGPYTFMILSLLYPQLKFGQVNFHQDHIHPASMFTDSKLRKFKIDNKKWGDWKYKKDRLANLQLMEGSENESKNKTPFKEWLISSASSQGGHILFDKDKFLRDNYIPPVNLDFTNFEEFYKKREKILINKIKKML